MPDTLTTSKSLTIQTPGGNANTWGGIANTNTTLIDKALGGTLTKALTGDVTLNATEAQNIGYEFTGALSADVTVTFPTFQGPIYIRNKTTGGHSVTVGMAAGETVVVPASLDANVYSDGTDFFILSTHGVNTVAATGAVSLAGGVLMQWGSSVVSGTTTINFATPFAAVPYSIVVTGQAGLFYNVNGGVTTTTSFSCVPNAAGSATVNWIAIGS